MSKLDEIKAAVERATCEKAELFDVYHEHFDWLITKAERLAKVEAAARALESQIMNIPTDVKMLDMLPKGMREDLAYKIGHRDARHAAADLLAAALAAGGKGEG